MATAIADDERADQALRDWSNALEGIKIDIDYCDVLDQPFHYTRIISTK